MNQKELKVYIDEIAIKLNPINQLLYEILILIVFYYVFNTLQNIKKHKGFLYLVTLICILLDFYIWSNTIQTSLFIAILFIYITYNINKSTTMDTFINTMEYINTKKNDIENDIENSIIQQWKLEEQEKQNQNEIDKITFIPKEFSQNTSTEPEPYDKEQSDINEIKLAYKSDTPNIRVTDTHYAKIMLNELYGTPQYQNIKQNEIDSSLDNNIHSKDANVNDELNVNLFRYPKKEFLDNSWLSKKENTYNDNCKHTTSQQNTSTNKNAICSLVKFGVELSECTNQENTITNQQLVKISNNNITMENEWKMNGK